MIATLSTTSEVAVLRGDDLMAVLPQLDVYLARTTPFALSYHPEWLIILARGLGHTPYCLVARRRGVICGFLPLSFIRHPLFGRFLVSQPYLNYGGVQADDEAVEGVLTSRAVALADELNVRYLELRNERAVDHPALIHPEVGKVHMRLTLPGSPEQLWNDLAAKVRNQVRKGQKSGLSVTWGGTELLSSFYSVFSQNMRDLGTPVYGRRLFRSVLERFPWNAELCVVCSGSRPVAAALLLHGREITEVPSASSLRSYNGSCANMLMYWHLLERAILRGQNTFDFGRSTQGGGTYAFKQQWGALPVPAEWQFYLRQGSAGDMRPGNPKFERLIQIWQRLPVALTRLIGPPIVRGIP